MVGVSGLFNAITDATLLLQLSRFALPIIVTTFISMAGSISTSFFLGRLSAVDMGAAALGGEHIPLVKALR
jgi:Na+-driven multidrug efflux pump